jgi:hypothetical protein
VLPMYLSPVLVLVVLVARVTMAVLRGIVDLLMLPARTALAVAPHLRRPQYALITGSVLTLILIGAAMAMLLGAAR